MLIRSLKLSVICLTVSNLIGCAEGLPEFPADYIFVVKPNLLECSRHKIIKKDPVTVDKGEFIPWDQCPHTFGFQDSDVGPVLTWIRNAQTEAKQRCK